MVAAYTTDKNVLTFFSFGMLAFFLVLLQDLFVHQFSEKRKDERKQSFLSFYHSGASWFLLRRILGLSAENWNSKSNSRCLELVIYCNDMLVCIICTEVLFCFFGFTYHVLIKDKNFLICLFVLGKKIFFLINLSWFKKNLFESSYEEFDQPAQNHQRKTFALDSAVKIGRKRPTRSLDTFFAKRTKSKKIQSRSDL